MCAYNHKPYWKVILGAYMSLQIPAGFLEYRSMVPKCLNLTCWLAISESHWTWCYFVKGPFAFHYIRNSQKLFQLMLSWNTLWTKITTNTQREWVWFRHYVAFPIVFPFGQAPFWCYPNNTKEEKHRCPTASTSTQNYIYAEQDPPAFTLIYADSAEKSSCTVMETPALHFYFYLAQRNHKRMTTSIINNPNIFWCILWSWMNVALKKVVPIC